MAVADGPSKSKEQPGGFYGLVTQFPWLFALFMPTVCLALLVVGIVEYETNDAISSFWSETAGKFYENEKYREESEAVLSGVSTGLFIAKERNGGNLFTAANLATVIAQMADVEEKTTVIVEGNTYTYEDVCAIAESTEHYAAPCVRITSMDMWQEAGYAWDKSFASNQAMQKWWFNSAIMDNLVPAVEMYATAGGAAGFSGPIASCAATGMPLDAVAYPDKIDAIAAFLSLDACSDCYKDTIATLEAGAASHAAIYSSVLSAAATAQAGTPVSVTITPDHIKKGVLVRTIRYLASTLRFAALSGAAFGIINSGIPGTNETTMYNIIDGTAGQYYWADPSLAAFGGAIDLQPDSSCTGTCAATPVNASNLAAGYSSSCLACTVPTNGMPSNYTGNLTNPSCQASNNFGHATGEPCVAFMDWAKWCSAIAAQGFDTTSTAKSDGSPAGYYNWAVDFLTAFAATGNNDVIGGNPFISTTGDPYRIQIAQQLAPGYKDGRIKFTGKSDADVLKLGSGNIYTFDEGSSIGNISKYLTLGGTNPPVGEYHCYSESRQIGVSGQNWNGANTCAAPLQSVKGVQTLYTMLRPNYIMQRVANASRPGGALTITEETAEKVMSEFKKAFEERWSAGWDNSAQAVQFTGFFDDAGMGGSFSRALDDVTTSGVPLTGASYCVLFVISVALLYSRDRQHSRVVAGAFGTIFSIIAFLGAIGITALSGKQLQIVQMWTLPFLMVGIGVDDMYIITLAINKAHSTSAKAFVETMNEVIVPVTMTSLTNLGMFAIMTLVTIPATYETAYTAMYAVGMLYATMLTAYPAVMYLDLKRQEGTCAMSCLSGAGARLGERSDEDRKLEKGFVYMKLFKPLLGNKIFHVVVMLVSAVLVGMSAYAITEFDVGIGIKEFAEDGTQLKAWAKAADELFPTWPMGMSWGDLDYTDPETQLHMVKQFESVISTDHVDSERDSEKNLWIGSLQIWGSSVCDNGAGKCGSDFTYSSTSKTCLTTWVKTTGRFAAYQNNKYSDYEGLNNRDTQLQYEGSTSNIVGPDTAPGVCVTGRRLAGQMGINGHCGTIASNFSALITSADYDSKFCPVFANSNDQICTDGVCADLVPYTEDELQYCMGKWREPSGHSGGSYNFKTYEDRNGIGFSIDPTADEEPEMPIKVTSASTIYAIDLTSHDNYVKMIEDARAVCDDDDTAPWWSDSSVKHGCWVRGIPVDYWTQYLGIEAFLVEICAGAVGTGVLVSTLFLGTDLLFGANSKSNKSPPAKLLAALVGALVIGLICALSVLTVIGLCTLLGVNLTVFSIMSYMMSVGYAVEYSVHIVHRFMTAPEEITSTKERAEFAMDFLFMPCFMAFLSSAAGIIVMAFSGLEFVMTFFFIPLFTCSLVTYWYGVIFLPVLLQYVGLSCTQVGASAKLSKRPSISKFASTDL